MFIEDAIRSECPSLAQVDNRESLPTLEQIQTCVSIFQATSHGQEKNVTHDGFDLVGTHSNPEIWHGWPVESAICYAAHSYMKRLIRIYSKKCQDPEMRKKPGDTYVDVLKKKKIIFGKVGEELSIT